MSCVVRGRTAVHARGLARSASGGLLRAGGGAVLVVFGLFLLYRSRSTFLLPATVVGGGGLLVAAFVWSSSMGKWSRAQAGIRAEELVARAFARSEAAFLLNGVVLGRGDIDHVVLGPWLLSVETKHGRGEIVLDRQSRLSVGGRLLPRDPLKQASTNARMLSRRTGREARAVLVVSEGTGGPLWCGDVVVCSPSSLPGVLRSLPRVLDPATAARLATSLPVAAQ